MGMGVWEVILIVGVILVFFGSRKLPQLARSWSEAKKEFKKSLAKEDEIDVTNSAGKGRIESKAEGSND
jgi:TatA/E family protein of Tat protein translocase